MSVISSETVSFKFNASKESTRIQPADLTPPSGAETSVIMLKEFEVDYTDNDQYGFGKFAIHLTTPSVQAAEATVTLRDNNTDEREWEGSVKAVVMYFSA